MNSKMALATIILATVLFSACNSKSTKVLSIRYAEDDSITHVKFRATIITGDDSKVVEAETPYIKEFVDQSFVVISYPQLDSVNLFMESFDKYNIRTSRVKGMSHGGTIFYIKTNGGPGYVGGSK